jgi:Putative metallopeptidase
MIRFVSEHLPRRASGFQSLSCALLVIMGLSGECVLAQPFRTQTVPPRAPSPEAQQAFQATMDEQVLVLAGDDRLRRLPQNQRQALLEFVTGNVLVAAIHQLGHALLSEFSVPTIGGADQAADDFAVLTVLELGKSHFSDRILMEAAKGGFISVRGKTAKDTSDYEHALSERRAYRMVCLVTGADPVRFKALAEEIALPRNLQRNCGWDYDSALRSWERILRPHRPGVDQPKTRIDVSYGVAAGNLAIYKQVFRNLRFLETIADVTASQIAWRDPLLLEMRSCGVAAAAWNASARTLSICYEMAGDLAELYRGLEKHRQ